MTQALVVGCGSIGTRHVGNLLELGVDVTCCDVSPEQLDDVADEYDVATTTDYEEALDESPDCVLVCTPPTTHVDVAIAALDADTAVFVEKPVAATAEEGIRLVERERTSDVPVYVACNMRFHPPVRLIDEWVHDGRIGSVDFLRLRYGNALPNWRPGDYREYYSASSQEGGGIVLDAIHEIDIADHLLDGVQSVGAATAKVSDLEIETEDTAEILFRGEGCLAEVHLDYVRPVRARTYEVIGSRGMIRWHAEGKNPERSRVIVSDADGNPLEEHEFESTLNEMYSAELRNFLDCVTGMATPPVDASRGNRLVRLAEHAKAASEDGTVRYLD